MSFLAKIKSINAEKVWFTPVKMYIRLKDGREIGVPLDWFPTLSNATEKQRDNWRLVGNGKDIHWEDLDEDISIKSLLS
jgi:hypothetical protein